MWAFCKIYKVWKAYICWGHYFGSVGTQSYGVIYNLGSAKMCLPATIETYFSYDKDTWIAVTDYIIYFYLIVLFLLGAVHQLINFTVS